MAGNRISRCKLREIVNLCCVRTNWRRLSAARHDRSTLASRGRHLILLMNCAVLANS